MRVTSRFMLFVVVAVVVVFVGLAVWANARSRRQLEALNEGSDDMQRGGRHGAAAIVQRIPRPPGLSEAMLGSD